MSLGKPTSSDVDTPHWRPVQVRTPLLNTGSYVKSTFVWQLSEGSSTGPACNDCTRMETPGETCTAKAARRTRKLTAFAAELYTIRV